jgi:hypothetical protein
MVALCRNRLQTPPPLHYPQAQDENRDPKYDHPIFKQEWSDMGLIEKERGNLFHTPDLFPRLGMS